MHLPEDLLWKHFKAALKALRVFSANAHLKSQPSLCCIIRIAFAKGNWAASSSLETEELTVVFLLQLLTNFHLKSLRLVNSPLTSHKYLCSCRSLQRLKGRVEKIYRWTDFALHSSCFIQVHR